MIHVSRRILVELKTASPKEYSETEFVEVDTPLILLGEPGSGKSDTAKHLSDIADGVLISLMQNTSSLFKSASGLKSTGEAADWQMFEMS